MACRAGGPAPLRRCAGPRAGTFGAENIAAGKASVADYAAVMSKLYRVFLLIVLIALAVGAVFLAYWEIPPPSAPVEKVIPNDRVFP